MTRLRVERLSRTFGGRPPVTALSDVDLSVEPGQLLAVLGPSGCGKTTLLRAIAGTETVDAGTVVLGDRLLSGPDVHVAPEHRAVGLVPQEGALFPHLDVGRNIGFGLHRLGRSERTARVEEMLALVELTGYANRRAHQLSGGQQQRVALARALAPRPDLVLLDEPFSALDAGLRATLRDEVARTLRSSGTTSVLVTHDQIEAMTMADSLAVMRSGRIVQVGAPPDVYRRPVDLWTARFLGEAVTLDGTRVEDHQVETVLGRLEVATDSPSCDDRHPTVFLRPEQIRPADSSDAVPLATVTAVRYLGPDAMVTLEVAGVRLEARWPSALLPSTGDRLTLRVDGPVLTYPAG